MQDYAKLSGAKFTGDVVCYTNLNIGGAVKISDSLFLTGYLAGTENKYLRIKNNGTDYQTYLTDGSLGDIGTQEDFVFTLEDGSTVTKSIRVLSTTNS